MEPCQPPVRPRALAESNTVQPLSRACLAGLSLIETLISVAVLGVIAAVAIYVLASSHESISDTKLDGDVAVLNAAVRSFIGNGGDFDGVQTATEAIARLKTEATGNETGVTVGLRGTMLDPRFVGIEQSESEAQGDGARVLWSAVDQRFVIARSGQGGIKKFVLDEGLAEVDFGEYEREVAVSYAAKKTDGSWVWDYTDRSMVGESRAPAPYGKQQVVVGFTGGSSGASAPFLEPPGFSIPGDNYELNAYEMRLNFHDWNPPGLAKIYYSLEPGIWQAYTPGVAVPVLPGTTVKAYAAAIDPGWNDSSHVSESYTADPVQLALNVSVPKILVTYAEAGGEMIIPEGYSADQAPADIPGPDPLGLGTIIVENSEEIPAWYHSSSTYNLFWTYDQSEPGISPTGESAPAFDGRAPRVEFDFHPSRWAGAPSLSISVAGLSFDETVVTDSNTPPKTLFRLPALLPKPQIELTGYHATISVDTSAGGRASWGADLLHHRRLESGRDLHRDLRVGDPLHGTDPDPGDRPGRKAHHGDHRRPGGIRKVVRAEPVGRGHPADADRARTRLHRPTAGSQLP